MYDKGKVKRVPKRALYDTESIHEILDKEFLCHVSFVHNEHPVVIPTLYGRKDNALYLHGAAVSRMMNSLEQGIDLCISVAQVNGIVLARSAFHHSANYESVVLFGKGTLVEGEEKELGLKVISDQVLQGRWEESRLPTEKEMAITKVIRIDIEQATGKKRTGGPVDDQRDYELDIWAGVIPVESNYGTPIPDEKLRAGIALPNSVKQVTSDVQ